MKKIAGIVLLLVILLGTAVYGKNVSATVKTEPNITSNLIKNGDFSNSLKNWMTIGEGINPYHPADPGRAGFKIENGLLEIDIKNPGKSIWSVMLFQDVSFEKGASYSISFDAKSDPEMEIISNVCLDGIWTNLSGDNNFKLTSVMSGYTYKFDMSKGGLALLQFCLGNIGTGKVFLDNIVLQKVDKK